MKKIYTIFLWVVIIFFGIILARNLIVKAAASGLAKGVLGLELDISKVSIGLTKPYIDVRGLKLHNPEDFDDDELMLDMPKIYVNYDLKAILRKDIHLRRLTLHLRNFTVVKNSKGVLNLDSLKLVRDKKKKSAAAKKEAKALPFRIDTLDLRIDKVIYKDYTKAKPRVTEFNIDINERYENITDASNLASFIVVRALAKTTISRLANFDIGALKAQADETLKSVSKLAADTAAGTIGIGKDAGKKATDTVSTIVKTVGKEFKQILPFPSKEAEK